MRGARSTPIICAETDLIFYSSQYELCWLVDYRFSLYGNNAFLQRPRERPQPDKPPTTIDFCAEAGIVDTESCKRAIQCEIEYLPSFASVQRPLLTLRLSCSRLYWSRPLGIISQRPCRSMGITQRE